MHARVASFENRNMSLVDDLVGTVRERVQAGRDLPDAKGLLMLIDRAGGKSLGISFFDSEEAIREAEPVFERMGDEIPESLRGRRTGVEILEVARQDVSEGAKAARVSSFEGPADKIDEGLDQAERDVLPRARQLQGWKGFVWLVDRQTGNAKLVTLWDSEESLRASEEQADRLREQSAQQAGARTTSVERYEVALAHGIGAGAAVS